MTCQQSPTTYSFVNNPIAFLFEVSTNTLRTISIVVGGTTFFLSAIPYQVNTGIYRFSFDISDIIKPFCSNMTMIDYSVNISQDSYTFTGKALMGGISKEMNLYLLQNNTNIFDFRLLNSINNFLFTTRTNRDIIPMRRNELGDVYFLRPTADEFSISTNTGIVHSLGTADIATPCALDLQALISSFSNADQVSEIYFCIAGVPRFKIVIFDSFSEQSYVLRFRNSMGVFEKLEITGKATRTPTFGDSTTFNQWDDSIKDFRQSRLRVPVSDKIIAEAGYKSTDDLYFIGDLLSSDEIYLMDRIHERKCLVSSDSYSHMLRQTIPESITLNIDFVDQDINISPISGIEDTTFIWATEGGDLMIDENNEFITV